MPNASDGGHVRWPGGLRAGLAMPAVGLFAFLAWATSALYLSSAVFQFC